MKEKKVSKVNKCGSCEKFATCVRINYAGNHKDNICEDIMDKLNTAEKFADVIVNDNLDIELYEKKLPEGNTIKQHCSFIIKDVISFLTHTKHEV